MTSYLRLHTSPDLQADDRFWRFLAPLLCYLAGVGVAIAFFLDDDTEIYWFVTIVALLLTVPTRNAWQLILESHEAG